MNFHAAVCDAIGRAEGEPFGACDVRRVRGGDISEAFTLTDGVRRFFVKKQPAARGDLFAAEAAGLHALAATEAVRVPRVVCLGDASGSAYLVLEYLALAGDGDAALLGRQLALQHRAGGTRYGWQRDNWIGATPQPNAWHDDWIAFLRDERLGFQLRLAAENGYRGALERGGSALLEALPAFFETYTPAPALLHGDLWGGNHGYLDDGTPVIFDPATYFGDRECDLAMSELFGGFAPAFFPAYREAWPLDAGYPARRTLYNLYHVLNHANLFGGTYAAQAERMVGQLLAEIR